jgi:hypothetical protein
VSDQQDRGLDLLSAAARYVGERFAPPAATGRSIASLRSLQVELDEDFCRDVAAHFDRAPRLAADARLAPLYAELIRENRRQYRAVVRTGVRIEPWLRSGQPYRDSWELASRVRETGRLYLYLTRSGHGPADATGYHPLREPAGVTLRGVELSHNDLFRVVHDIFGHVMLGTSFGPRGEFKATFAHLQMYPEDVHPLLFTEQIGQICWFYFGPHLLDRTGRPRRPGDREYLPPARRPYAEQKVFLFPPYYLDAFKGMFRREEPG